MKTKDYRMMYASTGTFSRFSTLSFICPKILRVPLSWLSAWCFPLVFILLLDSLVHTHIHINTLAHHAPSASGQVTSLAAGALAAVYDRQDDWLTLSTLTLQAEETDRVVRIQTVTTALTN